MSAAESVVSQIQHYQKSIQKYHGNSSKILHCINKLYSLPVTVQHLQDTGVGKTINSLRKSDGVVGDSARALVAKWKQMVEEESENEQESNLNVQAHDNYNEDLESGNRKERSDRRSRESYESSRDNYSREQSRSDHSTSLKRRRESETDQLREKIQKSDKLGNSSSHSSITHSSAGGKSNGSNRSSDEEWNIGRYDNGEVNSEDESSIRSNEMKIDRVSSQEQYAQFSDEGSQNGDFLSPSPEKESWRKKEEKKSSRKDKSSSHKQKHKSSSCSSDKGRHSSSSRSEHKESKSSSSKHSEKSPSLGSGSSSSRKEGNVSERSEERCKTKEKEKKDKHRSKDDKKSKEKKVKDKKADGEEDGVDSNSGKSFGEALGMMFPPDKPRKKFSSGASSSQLPSKKVLKSSPSASDKKSRMKDDSDFSPEENEASAVNFEPLEVDEDYGLPTLNPNYKPLPQPNFFNSPPKRNQNDDDDLSNIMYSKVQRTKVFSGNKSGYTYVPSLFDLCTRVLQENIDALEFTGGVPFDLLKPVLERATADQLFTLEHYNAYLTEDTGMFWEYHCKKDFRNKKREEMETWREMYMRCRDEREIKLKSLTANIAASSKAKALPVRKTQMAFVETLAKPPRNIARKQAKYGTGQGSSTSSASKNDAPGLSSSFTGRPSTAHPTGPAVAVPAPRGAGGSSHSNSCKPKPKAPLMQKALQLIKSNRFRR